MPFFSAKKSRARLNKMNNNVLTMMKYVFDIILIIALSFIYYLNEPTSSPRVIFVSKGSIKQIISQMQQANLNVSPLDVFLLKFIGSPQSGWIDMKESLNTKGDFLYQLTTSKAATKNVTLIPGETTYFFLDILSRELLLDREILLKEFNNQSPRIEGVFVPNTYALPIGLSEKMIIKILLNQSLKQMQNVSIKIFGEYDEKKWFHFVTLASIIQKESANIDEMPLVSSVIQNRLRKNMKLQMDGTLNYGEYSHTKITASRIREDESPYNTYLYAGVPPNPVCNVSFEAIKAAIFPATTTYLYFVKNKNATHSFSSNYSTHLTNITDATK